MKEFAGANKYFLRSLLKQLKKCYEERSVISNTCKFSVVCETVM